MNHRIYSGSAHAAHSGQHGQHHARPARDGHHHAHHARGSQPNGHPHGQHRPHHPAIDVTIPTAIPECDRGDTLAEELDTYIRMFTPGMSTDSHLIVPNTNNIFIMCMPSIHELQLKLQSITREQFDKANWHGAYRRLSVLHATYGKYPKNAAFYAVADAINTVGDDIPLHIAFSLLRMLKPWSVKNIMTNHNIDIAARLRGCEYAAARPSTVKHLPAAYKTKPIADPDDIHAVFADEFDETVQPGYGRWYITRKPIARAEYSPASKLTYFSGLFGEQRGELYVSARLPPADYDIAKIFDTPLRVMQYEVKGGRKINVIDESWLVGGGKQRLIYTLLPSVKNKHIFYRGPVNGYAQVCMGYACMLIGKTGHMIVNKQNQDRHQLTYLAAFLGVVIHEVDKPKDEAHNEEMVQAIVNSVGDAHIVPHGLSYDSAYDNFGKTQLRHMLDLDIKTIWIVASSGTLYGAIRQLLPADVKFRVLTVNGKPLPNKGANTEVFIHPLPFRLNAKIRPPYPAVETYDAKIWEYVINYADSGDYLFNIAGI